jgi:hypothetical protein
MEGELFGYNISQAEAQHAYQPEQQKMLQASPTPQVEE